jgi:hypothetical protein
MEARNARGACTVCRVIQKGRFLSCDLPSRRLFAAGRKTCCNSRLEINVSKLCCGAEFCDSGRDVRIGYARISTADQNMHLQQDALEKAGVNVFP